MAENVYHLFSETNNSIVYCNVHFCGAGFRIDFEVRIYVL